MDLLLYLIRRDEVNIHDIPISRIADQYLDHLREIDRIDIELAGEFLVMAATLMEIKSRMLAPAPAPVTDDAGAAPAGAADPRAELVEQLLAYRRYRDAANALESRKREWEQRYPAAPLPAAESSGESDASDDDSAVDIDDLALFDLVTAFARILETVDLDRAARASHEVQYDDTPIEVHAEDVLDQLRRLDDSKSSGGAPGAPGLTLRALLEGRPRAEMIGLFLAVLELTRRRSVIIAPTGDRHDVHIALNLEPSTHAPAGAEAAAP